MKRARHPPPGNTVVRRGYDDSDSFASSQPPVPRSQAPVPADSVRDRDIPHYSRVSAAVAAYNTARIGRTPKLVARWSDRYDCETLGPVMPSIVDPSVAAQPASYAVLESAEPASRPLLQSSRKAGGRPNWGPMFGIIGIHLAALLAFWPAMFTWKALLTALALQAVCGMGITIGFHRLLTHRSFRCSKGLEYILTLLGCLNLQGGPIKWTATHRLHHQHSDDEQDPHSPRHGFFWSHVLWCFTYDPSFDDYDQYSRYAKDLARDRGQVFFERTTVYWQFVLAAALYLWGGWPCVIWGIFVRLVYVYHATWFVNSASHTWGYRTYETSDVSRNLWWVALLSFGEGWHNNHHAFPRSARHGLQRWEVDVSWLVIRALSAVGLVRDVHLPDNARA